MAEMKKFACFGVLCALLSYLELSIILFLAQILILLCGGILRFERAEIFAYK